MKVATFLYKISLCFSQDMVETWWEIGGKYEGNYGDMMEIWWEIGGKYEGYYGTPECKLAVDFQPLKPRSMVEEELGAEPDSLA